jgi:enoyl-CoA hydratase
MSLGKSWVYEPPLKIIKNHVSQTAECGLLHCKTAITALQSHTYCTAKSNVTALMSRYVDAYMRLWRSPKPVIAQVHGYCVGGGTDLALCGDLIICAEDCQIGYPPARVWGSPTTAMWVYRLGLERSKRVLLTGDALDGRKAVAWGLASEAVPADRLDEAGLALARRVALLPGNQLHMMKLLINQTYEQMGLSVTQLIGTLLDGAARHTPEGTQFTRRAFDDVRRAVAERDRPFGDYGQASRVEQPGSEK